MFSGQLALFVCLTELISFSPLEGSHIGQHKDFQLQSHFLLSRLSHTSQLYIMCFLDSNSSNSVLLPLWDLRLLFCWSVNKISLILCYFHFLFKSCTFSWRLASGIFLFISSTISGSVGGRLTEVADFISCVLLTTYSVLIKHSSELFPSDDIANFSQSSWPKFEVLSHGALGSNKLLLIRPHCLD